MTSSTAIISNKLKNKSSYFVILLFSLNLATSKLMVDILQCLIFKPSLCLLNENEEFGTNCRLQKQLLHRSFTALHCTVLHYTALYYTALYCTTLHCTTLHCTALHCPALQCTTNHCSKLYCRANTELN